jgi:hypothetical protein
VNLGLIDALNKKAEPFYAPIPEARTVYVYTRQGGVNHRLRLARARPGWFRLRHAEGNTARICGRLPGASHMIDYLERFPQWALRAMFPSGEYRWAVLPYSMADAAQRGWDGSIRYCHLVRHDIEPGQTFVGCSVGHTLFYLRPKQYPQEMTDEHRAVIQGYYDELERQRQEEERRRREAAREEWRGKTLARLTPREQVELGGGRFVSLNEGVVTWSLHGQQYSMSVRPDGTIISAGVCLAGTDGWHNLTSIVGVMEEHQRLGREY